MKKQRKLVLSLLVLVALVVSGFTFAYWAGGITGSSTTENSTSIIIGKGESVTTVVTVNTGVASHENPLVPTTYKGSTTNDTVTLTFTVNWTGAGAAGAQGTLYAVVNSILIDGNDTINANGLGGDMFTAEPQVDVAITNGTAANYTITVVFAREPKDKITYDLVAEKPLVLNITFTVA